jgi:HK97 family phage prohead protease
MGTLLLRHSYELQDVAVTGRTLTLAVVPIMRPAWVEDETGRYRERFRSGAFDHVDPTRVQLRYQHSADLLDRVGAGMTMREDGRYLIGEARVFKGTRGDHMLDLVNDGGLRGVSVGFYPGKDERVYDQDGPLVERVKVRQMPEWSLVDEPAYAGAEVLAIRQATQAAEREQLAQWLAEMRRHAV